MPDKECGQSLTTCNRGPNAASTGDVYVSSMAMTITEFIKARLDDEQEAIEKIRACIGPNVQNADPYAYGAVHYHDSHRKDLNEAIESGASDADNLENAALRYAATRFSGHTDFQPEWNFRSWAENRFS